MKHLLDLQDLLEEELGQTFQAEKKLQVFIGDLMRQSNYQPLLDWMRLYRQVAESHIDLLNRIIYRLFIQLDVERTSVIEHMIKEYASEVNRTIDEDLRDEEKMLVLYRLVHYKIATYSSLYIHAKTLKLWDEMIELQNAMKEERQMESSLVYMSEKHHVFMNDWYSLN